MEQWERRLQGLEAKGTGHRTMRTSQTMGGRGVGGRRSWSGALLKKEKWLREGRKGMAVREVERWKQNERTEKGERTLRWSGPRLPAEGQWDEKRGQRHRRFPRLSRALSPGLARSGNCGLGSEARKGVPTSPGRTRSPGSPATGGLLLRIYSRSLKQSGGQDGTELGVVRRVLVAATSWGAERRDAQGGEGRGSAQAKAARRGRCGARAEPSQLPARLWLSAAPPPRPPVKLSSPSVALVVRSVSAPRPAFGERHRARNKTGVLVRLGFCPGKGPWVLVSVKVRPEVLPRHSGDVTWCVAMNRVP